MPGPDTLRSLQRSVSHDAHDSVAMPMETGKDEAVAGCRTGALRRVYEAGHLHRYNAKVAVVRPPTFATRLIIFVKSCLYELLPAFLSVIAMLLLERSHMYAINRAITPFSKKVISSPFWWITQVLWYPAVYGTMCVYLLTDNNVDSVEVYFGCFFIVLRAVMVSTKCIRKHARSVPRCHSPRKHSRSICSYRAWLCMRVCRDSSAESDPIPHVPFTQLHPHRHCKSYVPSSHVGFDVHVVDGDTCTYYDRAPKRCAAERTCTAQFRGCMLLRLATCCVGRADTMYTSEEIGMLKSPAYFTQGVPSSACYHTTWNKARY